jgi:hypothetical protein
MPLPLLASSKAASASSLFPVLCVMSFSHFAFFCCLSTCLRQLFVQRRKENEEDGKQQSEHSPTRQTLPSTTTSLAEEERKGRGGRHTLLWRTAIPGRLVQNKNLCGCLRMLRGTYVFAKQEGAIFLPSPPRPPPPPLQPVVYDYLLLLLRKVHVSGGRGGNGEAAIPSLLPPSHPTSPSRTRATTQTTHPMTAPSESPL